MVLLYAHHLSFSFFVWGKEGGVLPFAILFFPIEYGSYVPAGLASI